MSIEELKSIHHDKQNNSKFICAVYSVRVLKAGVDPGMLAWMHENFKSMIERSVTSYGKSSSACNPIETLTDFRWLAMTNNRKATAPSDLRKAIAEFLGWTYPDSRIEVIVMMSVIEQGQQDVIGTSRTGIEHVAKTQRRTGGVHGS